MKLKNKILILGILATIFYFFMTLIPYRLNSIGLPRIVAFLLFINFGLQLIYLLTWRQILKHPLEKKLIKLIIFFTIIFSLILILIPPIGSRDVYNYILRARIFTVYHENPYLLTTENFPDDIFFSFSPPQWNYLSMQYGPLWSVISIIFSFLAKNNFFWNVFFYKILALLTNFGIIYFLSKILKKTSPAYELTGIYLYAWNPLILFETLNNAHNDILMVFFVIVAIYLFMQKKFIFSMIILFSSVLVKYITIILLPIFLILIIKETCSLREKIKFLLKIMIVFSLITIIFYFPFWEGLKTFNGLLLQSRLENIKNLSLFTFFIFGGLYGIKKFFFWSTKFILDITRIIGGVIFFILYCWQLIHLKKTCARNIIYYIFLILSFLTLTLVFLQPWYFLWLLPLAILINNPYITLSVFAFTFIGLISYTPFDMSFSMALTFIIILFLSIIFGKRYFLIDFFSKKIK